MKIPLYSPLLGPNLRTKILKKQKKLLLAGISMALISVESTAVVTNRVPLTPPPPSITNSVLHTLVIGIDTTTLPLSPLFMSMLVPLAPLQSLRSPLDLVVVADGAADPWVKFDFLFWSWSVLQQCASIDTLVSELGMFSSRIIFGSSNDLVRLIPWFVFGASSDGFSSKFAGGFSAAWHKRNKKVKKNKRKKRERINWSLEKHF